MSKDELTEPNVCEWQKKIIEPGVYSTFKTSCYTLTDTLPIDGVCPYCKKPIKIVEEE